MEFLGLFYQSQLPIQIYHSYHKLQSVLLRHIYSCCDSPENRLTFSETAKNDQKTNAVISNCTLHDIALLSVLRKYFWFVHCLSLVFPFTFVVAGNDCLQVSNYRSYIFLLICNLCLPLYTKTLQNITTVTIFQAFDVQQAFNRYHLIYEVSGQFAH